MQGYLIHCKICERASAFTDEYDVCDKCKKEVPPGIYFKRKGHGIMPITQSGYILTPFKWFEIKRQVDDFFYHTPIENIEALNEETRRHRKEQTRFRAKSGPQIGYVYIIRSDSGHYKIGKANNIEQRLDSLRKKAVELGAIVRPPGFSTNLEVIHSIRSSDVFRLETYLHRELADFRILGEWFELPDERLNWLLSLNEEICITLLI